MRTNIVLDDFLVKKGMKLAGTQTKKELIQMALKEFVRNHSQLDLRDLKGKISFRKDYAYKAMRQSDQ